MKRQVTLHLKTSILLFGGSTLTISPVRTIPRGSRDQPSVMVMPAKRAPCTTTGWSPEDQGLRRYALGFEVVESPPGGDPVLGAREEEDLVLQDSSSVACPGRETSPGCPTSSQASAGYAVQDVEVHAFQHHAARFLDLDVAFDKTTPHGSELLEAPLHGLDDERQVLIGDAQRRCHDQHVVDSGRGISIVAKYQPSFVASGDDFIHHTCTNRLLALLVLHEFYAAQKPFAADVSHVGVALQFG